MYYGRGEYNRDEYVQNLEKAMEQEKEKSGYNPSQPHHPRGEYNQQDFLSRLDIVTPSLFPYLLNSFSPYYNEEGIAKDLANKENSFKIKNSINKSLKFILLHLKKNGNIR